MHTYTHIAIKMLIYTSVESALRLRHVVKQAVHFPKRHKQVDFLDADLC